MAKKTKHKPIKSETKSEKQGSGLDDNIAGALCYLLGLITGIIFLIVDKDKKFVKFHAMQSIIFSVAWIILWIVLGIVSFVLAFIPIIGWLISMLIWLVMCLGGLIIWLFLMYKAYNKEMYELPVIGKIAREQANK